MKVEKGCVILFIKHLLNHSSCACYCDVNHWLSGAGCVGYAFNMMC